MELRNKMNLQFIGIILVLCASAFGCSTKEDLDTRGTEIRLGVSGVTRTVINDLKGLQTVGNNIGIYGVKTFDHISGPGEDWSNTPFSDEGADGGTIIMNNVKTTSIDDNGTVHWNGRFYYPLDEDAGIKFCAYYPYTAAGYTITGPAVGQAPVLNLKLDGTQDVMYASPVVGWRAKTDATNLKFRHALTQLSFILIDSERIFVGKKLNSIVLHGVNTTGKMDIETGETTDWGTPETLSVADIDAVEITEDAAPANENTPAKGQKIGSEIMLQPGLQSFTVEVTVDGIGYGNIIIRPASPSTTFEMGKSYRITLNFNQKTGISAGATVEPWIFGGSGFAEVI